MKKTFFSLTTCFILLAACNNGENKKDPAPHDMNSMAKDSGNMTVTRDDTAIKTVAVTFTNMDATASASIKAIVDHYLYIKNALANDNNRDAASGAGAMKTALNKLDKSLLTTAQKTAYDNMEEELKEHAEHIADNGNDIKHQRSHFVLMSEVMYQLVKNFGAGRPLYHDHCPMARDNQGAMWLSELKEVKNPYFGAVMPVCGTVEEVIK